MPKVEKPSHHCPKCGRPNYLKSAEGWRPFCSEQCAKSSVSPKQSFLHFTARFLQKKTAYGYDISGEVTEGSGPIADKENQTNINDTAQPQDHHETPRNPNNMVLDTEAEKEFPEELEGRGGIQGFLPVRQK